MNETERAENPIAEAVRGLMRDRTFLIKEREDKNRSWSGYDSYCGTINREIEALDNSVNLLCQRHTEILKEKL